MLDVYMLYVYVVGEGPHLKVFSSNGYLITQVELLPFCTIHGIRPSCGKVQLQMTVCKY